MTLLKADTESTNRRGIKVGRNERRRREDKWKETRRNNEGKKGEGTNKE
jgi:hypothetical protein